MTTRMFFPHDAAMNSPVMGFFVAVLVVVTGGRKGLEGGGLVRRNGMMTMSPWHNWTSAFSGRHT